MIGPGAFALALVLVLAACVVWSRIVDRLVPWLDRLTGGRG